MFVPAIPLHPLKSDSAPDAAMLASRLDADEVLAYRDGRSALRAVLEQLDFDSSGRIWLPALLCRSVTDTVRILGRGCCRLYDVDDNLLPRLNAGTLQRGDLFVWVNFFGLRPIAPFFRQCCRERGVFMIEDGAHTLPLSGSRQPSESLCEFRFYSLRKMLPVTEGALLAIRHDLQMPAARFTGGRRPEDSPGGTHRKSLPRELRRIAFRMGFNPLRIRDTAVRLRRWRQAAAPGFGGCGGAVPLGRVHASPKQWEARALVRAGNYRWLVARLRRIRGIRLPFAAPGERSSPQVLPLRVDNASALCRELRRRGIEAANWPGDEAVICPGDPDFPGADGWMREVVTLPIHEDLTQRHLAWMSDTLERSVFRVCRCRPLSRERREIVQ